MNKNNILEYKGYHTKVEFDSENFILTGKIEGINDLVNFECEDINEVEHEFHAAVDDYLEFCKEVGKEPDKEYKGTFNVRIDPALHKQLSNMAMKSALFDTSVFFGTIFLGESRIYARSSNRGQ